MKQTTWNVALIQSDISLGEPDLNKERLQAALEQAAAAEVKPDCLVLPEMWNTGYALDRIQELADPEGKETRVWVSELAAKHAVNIVAGSIAEKAADGKVRNTMLVFDRQGREIDSYSKIHLFGLMQEDKALAAGQKMAAFELDGILSGAAICYDIRFPELARSLALAGAKVMFVPAEWPHPRLHHWRTLLMARAIENQMYVIACNRVGQSGNDHFFGHSMVIDPWGEIIAEAGETETVLTAQIPLQLVDEVRGRIPVFEDRRPELYRL